MSELAAPVDTQVECVWIVVVLRRVFREIRGAWNPMSFVARILTSSELAAFDVPR